MRVADLRTRKYFSTDGGGKPKNKNSVKQKMKKYLATVLAVLAGLAFITPSAKAAYSYTDGDLFLGVYSSTKNQDYLIYIGNYTNYTTNGGAYTGATITLNTAPGIAIGSASQINADLTAVFGSGWYTDSNVKFGVVGTLDYFGANNMFVTDPNAAGNTSNWTVFDAGTQGAASGDAYTLASVYQNGTANGATATNGKIQSTTTAGSYYDYSPLGTVSSGASYEYYTGGIDTSSRSIKLAELVATDGSLNGLTVQPDGSKNILGTFTIASNGTITYAAAIPEPSTYAMMGIGTLAFVVMIRRRNKMRIA